MVQILLVNFFNVKKKFKTFEHEKVIIKNFNYKLMKGEKLGIIGKNGSGKSTFLNLVVNNSLIDEGSIKIRKNVRISFFLINRVHSLIIIKQLKKI